MFKTAKTFLTSFRRDEDGATLVEYGIALGLAITVGVGAMAALGGDVNDQMTDARCALNSTNDGCTPPSDG